MRTKEWLKSFFEDDINTAYPIHNGQNLETIDLGNFYNLARQVQETISAAGIENQDDLVKLFEIKDKDLEKLFHVLIGYSYVFANKEEENKHLPKFPHSNEQNYFKQLISVEEKINAQYGNIDFSVVKLIQQKIESFSNDLSKEALSSYNSNNGNEKQLLSFLNSGSKEANEIVNIFNRLYFYPNIVAIHRESNNRHEKNPLAFSVIGENLAAKNIASNPNKFNEYNPLEVSYIREGEDIFNNMNQSFNPNMLQTIQGDNWTESEMEQSFKEVSNLPSTAIQLSDNLRLDVISQSDFNKNYEGSNYNLIINLQPASGEDKNKINKFDNAIKNQTTCSITYYFDPENANASQIYKAINEKLLKENIDSVNFEKIAIVYNDREMVKNSATLNKVIYNTVSTLFISQVLTENAKGISRTDFRSGEYTQVLGQCHIIFPINDNIEDPNINKNKKINSLENFKNLDKELKSNKSNYLGMIL